jgi:hypothetical protein
VRILSKFKDYYDFAQPYYDGGENSVTFIREQKTYEKDVDKFLVKDFSGDQRIAWKHPQAYVDFPEVEEALGGSTHAEQYFIAIADQLVSFHKITLDSHRYEDFYFSTERGVKVFKINRYRSNKNTIPEILKTSDYKKVVELQQEFDSPIILIHFGSNKKIKIVVNPSLMEYKINHLLGDSKQIYQEIEMWLTNHNNKVVESSITDKEKIVSHGFDKKTSFRHPIK